MCISTIIDFLAQKMTPNLQSSPFLFKQNHSPVKLIQCNKAEQNLFHK